MYRQSCRRTDGRTDPNNRKALLLKIMCVNSKLTFVIKFIEENIELVTFSTKKGQIYTYSFFRLKLFQIFESLFLISRPWLNTQCIRSSSGRWQVKYVATAPMSVSRQKQFEQGGMPWPINRRNSLSCRVKTSQTKVVQSRVGCQSIASHYGRMMLWILSFRL